MSLIVLSSKWFLSQFLGFGNNSKFLNAESIDIFDKHSLPESHAVFNMIFLCLMWIPMFSDSAKFGVVNNLILYVLEEFVAPKSSL